LSSTQLTDNFTIRLAQIWWHPKNLFRVGENKLITKKIMKNLELQSLGLRELDAREMVEMEGGKGSGWFAVLDALDEFVDGFIEGWNEAKKRRP
jgi:hypothetical protein